jgi:homocysteine S-methyltransferase
MAPHPDLIAQALDLFDVLVLDGAMGTELERRGCDLADPLWSARVLIEQPGLIAQVHADYLAAGADVIVTASYQASLEGFARRGMSEREARRLIGASVEISRSARDVFWDGLGEAGRQARPRPILAGSVGPYGAFLADGSEFRGDYPLDRARLDAFHRPRIASLLEAGVEILALETLPSAREAEILLDLIEREFSGARAWVSFSARDASRISNGDDLGAAVHRLAPRAPVAAIGVNCTRPELIAGLIGAVAANTDKPILAYPNGGGGYDAANHSWEEPDAPLNLAGMASDWRARGARLIGGCCRTTPRDIAALSRALAPL